MIGTFNPGDVVRLKSSSGPLMTVESEPIPGYSKVVWFIGSEYQTAHIANEALELNPDRKGTK